MASNQKVVVLRPPFKVFSAQFLYCRKGFYGPVNFLFCTVVKPLLLIIPFTCIVYMMYTGVYTGCIQSWKPTFWFEAVWPPENIAPLYVYTPYIYISLFSIRFIAATVWATSTVNENKYVPDILLVSGHLTSLTPGLTVTILPTVVNKYLLLLHNQTVTTTLYYIVKSRLVWCFLCIPLSPDRSGIG